MQKQFKRALFLFRRDLRLEDNTALLFAFDLAEKVIPAFIFTPEQIKKNPYRSDHCLRFMIESLEELALSLEEKGGRLFLFQGKIDQVLHKILPKIDAIVVNKDYTPYSQKRDKLIESVCSQKGIPFFSFDDLLLHPPEATLKQDKTPYSVFTPYFRNALQLPIDPPKVNRKTNYCIEEIPSCCNLSLLETLMPKEKGTPLLIGGRKGAIKQLKQLADLKAYATLRDFPEKEYSSHLSSCLKFTLCSAREVHKAIVDSLGPHHPLIRSLFWRDFFTQIAYFFPHVFQGAFHQKFDQLSWSDNHSDFARWCEGSTGFPIVDAGMREMNETGFMHNRVRMIAASFLVKDLHIHWQSGEKYFARTLIDYDPCVNNGNWQWVASTGCDAQPYFRVFNPWIQQKKFDPDCVYIKKWIPELREFLPEEIHGTKKKGKYPEPMVDHAKEAAKAIALYKRIS